MSASALIEAVKAEGFGRGGVVAAALGDVQVAGVFEGRGDGGADGSQVDGARCRCGWRRHLPFGLAMTPTVASATSRWRLTREPLACCSPIALPARRRRACRLRDTRFRSR
jgi:hypothetical protein